MVENGNMLIFARCKDFDIKPNFYVNVIPYNELVLILQECGFSVVYHKNLDEMSVCLIAKKQI